MSFRSRWLSLFRTGFCGGVFALGFGGMCWAIRASLPFPEVPIIQEKLRHLAERQDEYDTLFIGSSRIYFQIMPSLFDQFAAERGLPTRSFNAGASGMRPVEDSYLLDKILEHPPRHLRWVFIELAGIRMNLGDEKKETMRAQYWHDWPRLKLLFQRALTLKPVGGKKRKWKQTMEDLRESLGEFIEHFDLFVRRQINLGRGSLLTSRMENAPPPEPASIENTLGRNLDGWVPTGRPEEMIPVYREMFDRELAKRREMPAARDLADPISQRALETMIGKIEKHRARAVLITPPTTSKRNFYPRPDLLARAMVLEFCDPQKFPELFEPRNRLDTDHVNSAGAEVFTRALVNAWADRVEGRR